MKRLLLLLLLSPGLAHAGRVGAGGYFRIGARPDGIGGGNKLGYWNLYGRLLNEGPYGALELKFDVLEGDPLSRAPTTSIHAKIEGGSIANADASNGALSSWRVSQVYARAGNVVLPHVTWQLGTLDTYFGDLGLYDMKPAEIFYDTVGLSGRWESDKVELLLGAGDAGYAIHGAEYSSVLTGGGTIRVRLGKHLELGTGGQYRFEPKVVGNRYAPHDTPGISYEDYLRGEVVERYLMEYPDREVQFPDPVPTSARSWKAVGYLGFGGLGPIVWDNAFVKYERLHPESRSIETYEGAETTLYTTSLTDQRTVFQVGNELQLRLWPRHLDASWGLLYGDHSDLDNVLAPSDHNRTYMSTVLRLQAYLNPTVHLLVESSIAREHSKNGNAWREHLDSLFTNTGGVSDSRGFEYGDTDTRDTWQGKGGFVLNPLGPGIYTRPSLRVLYGVQRSNQNNAFGNSFVESLDQYEDFESVERHWHQLVSLEMEAWF